MLSIRRPWWAALVLASFAAGCTNETATTPAETPSVSTPSPSPAPAPTVSPAVDTGKPGMTAEMAPAPSKTEEAPKDEAPGLKIEAPKVEPPAKSDEPKAEAPAKDEKPEAAADAKLSEEEIAEIKKLPAGEQAVALKQVLCPVSGEHLGSMEAPVKVSAEGRTFYLCCASCKKEVDKNPKEVVSKLASK